MYRYFKFVYAKSNFSNNIQPNPKRIKKIQVYYIPCSPSLSPIVVVRSLALDARIEQFELLDRRCCDAWRDHRGCLEQFQRGSAAAAAAEQKSRSRSSLPLVASVFVVERLFCLPIRCQLNYFDNRSRSPLGCFPQVKQKRWTIFSLFPACLRTTISMCHDFLKVFRSRRGFGAHSRVNTRTRVQIPVETRESKKKTKETCVAK